MSAALAPALAVVLAALVSAVFGWLSHRGNAKVEQVAALLDAYNEIVKNLQNELQRVQTELATVREEMRDCEKRAVELKHELEEMKIMMVAIHGSDGNGQPPRKRSSRTS